MSDQPLPILNKEEITKAVNDGIMDTLERILKAAEKEQTNQQNRPQSR